MNQMTYLDAHGKTIKFMFGKNYHRLYKSCDFVKLVVPVAGTFFANFWLYEDGDLWHAMTECGSANLTYSYIEDMDSAKPPTDAQVDTVLSLLKDGYQVEGWDCKIRASAPLQRWMQKTSYGKNAVTHHYAGVCLA